MSSHQLMAKLRSMLHADYPRADEIIELVQSFPTPQEREVAEQYVTDHFRQTHARSTMATRLDPSDVRMHFDLQTRTLSKADGTLLKQMCCPLEKQWGELDIIDEQDMTRHCTSCEKRVVDTRGLDANQVHALVRYDPKVCLHIDESYGNVEVLRAPSTEERTESGRRADRRVAGGLRVIRTARTRIEMNLAAALGHWPLIRRVDPSDGKIGSFLAIWQNTRTGEVREQSDIRYFSADNYEDWTRVFNDLNYDPSRHFPEPYAAYIVPPDLEAGERVYLEDLIENFVGSRHHGSYRLPGAEAIWTGEDFDIQYDEERDVQIYIG